jgi:molecular chaperone GrpE
MIYMVEEQQEDPSHAQEGPNQPGRPEEQQPIVSETEVLNAKLQDALKQAEQYKDLFLRKAAEFDNYKKRIENESGLLIRFANEELIGGILPILDDFERSLKLSKERKDIESLYRGVELVYQKLVKALEAQGIKPIETVGKSFNVHYHDALMQMPREDIPPLTILEEVEKGYTFHDKVIRHSKVVVSSAPSRAEQSIEQSIGSDRHEKSGQTGT